MKDMEEGFFVKIGWCCAPKSTRVRAKIKLLSMDAGGRKTPINCKLDGYRPDHHFDWLNENYAYIGKVQFTEDTTFLFPGESAEVLITFISDATLDENLMPGLTWDVREGPFVVGQGTILEVVEI